jgi:Holliday junction resolvasome RuvABC endonuclease subunit
MSFVYDNDNVRPSDGCPPLALDVSTVCLGYAYGRQPGALASGSISLSPTSRLGTPRWPLARRLQELVTRLGELLDHVRPGLVLIERPDHARGRHYYSGGNHATSLALGQAIGASQALCWQRRLTVETCDAQDVRYRLLGNGGKSKDAVQWYLTQVRQLVLPLRDAPDGQPAIDHDACDALALLLYHLDEQPQAGVTAL